MESQIEQKLIEKLVGLKYVYRTDIRDRKTLESNFREKFNLKHYCNLSDSEFDRLLSELVEKDVFKCSKKLREQQLFYRDDGSPIYFNLIDTDNWCKNSFEVVNQLKINTQNSNQRYDVVILINGLPLVQIELKNHGINPRKAMQQIIDYKQDKGNGYLNTLLCFMQLFIVSNEIDTFYFTNNNDEYLQFDAKEQFLPIYRWADTDNQKIVNLDKFADCFLDKYQLGEMLSRYMVLVNTERKVLIMRPYQIYAVKSIINTIESNGGNGYIWHTTGSGKTLTSFKASTLLKNNEDIYKCLFVVDRKDLDRQTRQEFNKFQDGCVEENTNTETLVWRLMSTENSNKVIVTTIQKLYKALTEDKYKDRLEEINDERFVFIFDECHRSQFGENNKVIRRFFPNSQMFGFTGTPIFDDNAVKKQFEGEEGTKLGLTGADDSWLKKHEQDPVRTLYIHDAYLKNDFKLNEKIDFMFKYALNYRTRHTAQRLYANYSASSGIYDDPWFDALPGRSTLEFVNDEGDTLVIDSAHWARYYALADEDFLATQFVEKLMKHTLELGFAFKLPKNVLKAGATLVVFTDMSKFEQNELLSPFDFRNKTYGVLGYYCHGSDDLEQRYPISLTTTTDYLKNTVSVMPRYKIYNRNDMREFEWSLMDNMEVEIVPEFMDLSLSGGLRQNLLSYEIEDEDYDEMELDIDASAKLRIHLSPSLYTDWTVGSIFNYRPDSKADQYKDFYIIAALNYDF